MQPFTYDGSFDLSYLLDDECVYAAGDYTGACIVESPDGLTRIEKGDIVHRHSKRLNTIQLRT